jgi:hypothetical protein
MERNLVEVTAINAFNGLQVGRSVTNIDPIQIPMAYSDSSSNFSLEITPQVMLPNTCYLLTLALLTSINLAIITLTWLLMLTKVLVLVT